MKKYTSTTEQMQPPTPEHAPYNDRLPLHSWVPGLLLPLAQSAADGFIAMLVVAAMIFAFGGESYVRWMFLAFVLTTAASYFIYRKRWLRLTDLEGLLGLDLNRDKVIGEPRSVRVQLDKLTPQGHIDQSEIFEFGAFANEDQLAEFFTAVIVDDKGMTETTHSGLDDGRPFSLDDFRDFRGELVRRRLAEAVMSSTGKVLTFRLTPKGRTVGEQILKDMGLPHAPARTSPTDDFGPLHGETGTTHVRTSRKKKAKTA